MKYVVIFNLMVAAYAPSYLEAFDLAVELRSDDYTALITIEEIQ